MTTGSLHPRRPAAGHAAPRGRPARHRAAPTLAAALLATAFAAGCPVATLDVLDVEVLDHPSSSVSCVVRWNTGVPASARVEFGAAGEGPRWSVASDAETVDHELTVFGLYPDADFDLWVVSDDEQGDEVRSGPLTYTTGELPFAAADIEVTAYEPDRMEPGWTLVNLVVHSIMSPAIAMALDPEGRVRWYHQLGPTPAFADVEVSWVGGDRVLIGGDLAPGQRPTEVDFDGQVHWQGIAQPEPYLAPGTAHHTFQRLPGGDHLTMTYDERGGTLIDVIERRTPDGELVWSWDAADHIDGAAEEHVHGNMALVDVDSDDAWFNSLVLGTLYKIDRATGEIVWAFGEGGDFAMLTDHERPWVVQAHAPEFTDAGTLLMYDNGIYPAVQQSRVVEYALDEEAMTAELIWEYPGALADDPWFTSFWGDADRLANGNTLVNAGTVFDFNTPSRLFEVTADGDVVWSLTMTSEVEGMPAGAYAAERFPVPLGTL